jgi:hypothetical protein
MANLLLFDVCFAVQISVFIVELVPGTLFAIA